MSERDMKAVLRRPDHAEGCKMDGCALVGECFHGAALAEVTRLREALEQVDGDVARRCAEAVAPLITALVHVVEECREEYCNVASGGPSACVVCSIARAALAAGKGGT